jgi:hypothetical protein
MESIVKTGQWSIGYWKTKDNRVLLEVELKTMALLEGLEIDSRWKSKTIVVNWKSISRERTPVLKEE